MEAALNALFERLPLAEAMPHLVVSKVSARRDFAVAAVDELVGSPCQQAGVWLYVDDLEESHAISQSHEDPLAAYWHGIMHRREGDFGNAKYWFRRAAPYPIHIDGYDPQTFTDLVERAAGVERPELIKLQRREWQSLFEHCRAVGA